MMSFLYYLLPRRRKLVVHGAARAGGALPNERDDRDLLSLFVLTPKDAPRKVLRQPLSPVENQGYFNSCVACSVTAAVEYHALKHQWPHFFELSRMHLWNEARKLSRTYPKNEGCYIRDAWKASQKQGIVIEKLFPYNETTFNKEPSSLASVFRKWYPSFKYVWIRFDTENNIKEKLLQETPVVFAIRVPKSFLLHTGSGVYNPSPPEEMHKGGVVKPSMTEKTLYAHAMLITGYDETLGAFEIRNSWGQAWGRGGYAWVNKDWVLEQGFDFSYCTEV